MRMPPSAKELLYNLPIDVDFAGFRSTTYSLGRAGWDLSLRQQNEIYDGGYTLQLAMRHGDRNTAIYALSHPLILERYHFEQMMAEPATFASVMRGLHFSIAHVAPDIRFQIMPVRGFSMVEQFMPISSIPEERTQEESIRDFKFFKVANNSVKDLIVLPEQVPDLLDAILKVQKPTQQEIKKRIESRVNFKAYGDGEMFSAKPSHTVQAQIITLTG